MRDVIGGIRQLVKHTQQWRCGLSPQSRRVTMKCGKCSASRRTASGPWLIVQLPPDDVEARFFLGKRLWSRDCRKKMWIVCILGTSLMRLVSWIELHLLCPLKARFQRLSKVRMWFISLRRVICKIVKCYVERLGMLMMRREMVRRFQFFFTFSSTSPATNV